MNVFLICSARISQVEKIVHRLREQHKDIAVTYYIKENARDRYSALMTGGDNIMTYDAPAISFSRPLVREINRGAYQQVIAAQANGDGSGYFSIYRMLLSISKPCFIAGPDGYIIPFRFSLFFFRVPRFLRRYILIPFLILIFPLYVFIILSLLLSRVKRKKRQPCMMYVPDTSIDAPLPRSQSIPLVKSMEGWKKILVSYDTPSMFNPVTTLERKKKWLDQGIFIITLPQSAPFPKLVTDLWLLPLLALRHGITLYHSRTYHPALAGILLKKFALIKFIFDPRGVYPEEAVYLGTFKPGGFMYQVFKRIERAALNTANLNIVVSRRFERYLKTISSKHAKYLLMPTYLDDQLFHRFKDAAADKTRYKKQLGFGPGDLVFVYSGSTAKWQMLDTVLDIYRALNAADPRCKLLMLIAEHFKSQVEAQTRDIPGVTIKTCATAQETIQSLLAGDAAFLLREDILINNVACPTKFAEYLLAGLPVIVTPNIGDIELYMHTYRLGLIMNPGIITDSSLLLEKLKEIDYQDFLDRRTRALEDHFLAGRYLHVYSFSLTII